MKLLKRILHHAIEQAVIPSGLASHGGGLSTSEVEPCNWLCGYGIHRAGNAPRLQRAIREHPSS
jgi:hypothetical protein